MPRLKPIRFEDGRPMLLGGVRQRHSTDGAEASVVAQWQRFLDAPPLPGRVGTALYGVMCGGDASGFEYLCGVEVASLAELPEGAGRMRVPPQRYAVFEHTGGAADLRATWQGIFAWLASGNYDSAHKPDFELYQPPASPLTGGAAEVWVGVVPKARATA